VKAAQQMHGVGKVAARMRPGGFEESVEVRMARATVARDPGELGLGNADRL
jgi:hypothetical protein